MGKTESKITTNRVKNEDGSSIETSIEEVNGGFIKTVSKRFKDDNGEWQYSDEKSVSTTDPSKEKSLIDKLEDHLNTD